MSTATTTRKPKPPASPAERRRTNLRNHLVRPLAAVALVTMLVVGTEEVRHLQSVARTNDKFNEQNLRHDKRIPWTVEEENTGISTAVSDIYGDNLTHEQAEKLETYVQQHLPPEYKGAIPIRGQLFIPVVPGVNVVNPDVLKDVVPPEGEQPN